MGTREQYIRAGVRNLREFGYPSVDEKNILTDAIYKKFFKAMLQGNVGDPSYNDAILKAMISELEAP